MPNRNAFRHVRHQPSTGKPQWSTLSVPVCREVKSLFGMGNGATGLHLLPLQSERFQCGNHQYARHYRHQQGLAIVHPLSFRVAHTKRFTVTVCVIMWLYLHVMDAVMLVDRFTNPVDDRATGCVFNPVTLSGWLNVSTIMVFILPFVATQLSFLAVMVNRVLRSRAAIGRSARLQPLSEPVRAAQ
ncbi:hypothetical protein BV898_15380 [Hypsibius exemplaris]|uniref:G-protein coupled receptors family 1 profile domain-containing protein n=1 Tax=Hypsibius exemplaris TaxID=2072580 RepID=A0A9X6NAV8_HYPEX|nr:hypothetical protein BV898_15380 [Hypsibius exemplaris]